MNWPSIYMRPLHPELPSFLSPHPVSSRLSQSTSFRCPASYVQLALTYGNIYVSILFSQIIPSSPSPTESKSLFFTSVSPLLSFMASVTVCSDFRAQENKICHCFHFSPSICHEVMGLDATILSFLNVEFQVSFFAFLFHFHQEAF